MAVPSRQSEVRPDLVKVLQKAGRKVTSIGTLIEYTKTNQYMEGTGVVVADHLSKTIFAALSERCCRAALQEYAEMIGYEKVTFQTILPSGKPIYHTNVMLAIGEQFCVICSEVIPTYERQYILKTLGKKKEIIDISLEQMNSFCGNLL